MALPISAGSGPTTVMPARGTISLMKVEPLAEHPEYQDRQARLEVMDQQGIGAALLFPTFGCGVEQGLKDDVPATMATLSAFNRWLEEDWGFAFEERLLYRWVRHPLMLGFLIAFWSTPVMTQGHLLFAVVTTAYVLVAVQIEERTLVHLHGDRYRDYQRRVSMLLPLGRTRGK